MLDAFQKIRSTVFGKSREQYTHIYETQSVSNSYFNILSNIIHTYGYDGFRTEKVINIGSYERIKRDK